MLHPADLDQQLPFLHMKLSKPPNNRSNKSSKPTDRFAFITDGRLKLVIPVGRRFQVEVPPWTHRPSRRRLEVGKSDGLKWLGTQIWPLRGGSKETNHSVIGRGRPEACECAIPGSIECVRHHVAEKKFRLRIDLGPAFWKWRFDEMGEDASKLWNHQEQKKFEYIVKTTAKIQGKSFIDSAREYFSGHSRRSMISYYLNVYIPRRISVQSRLGYVTIDTDDEGEDMLCMKGSRKRLQAINYASSSRKYVKMAYLTA